VISRMTVETIVMSKMPCVTVPIASVLNQSSVVATISVFLTGGVVTLTMTAVTTQMK
jgi:hypothetical protein